MKLSMAPRRTPPLGLALALSWLTVGGLSAQDPPDLQAGDLVVVGGQLFDATGTTVRANPGIHVRDGTIVGLGVDVDGGLPPGVEVLEVGPDRTILPGFIDLHAHYGIDLFGTDRIDEFVVNPVVYLANGVTSTFPAGEVDPEGMRLTRIQIDANERAGPRIFNSGPYFGTARAGWASEAMTPDSIAAEVAYWVEQGVRGFKAKGIGPEQLQALITAAHERGLTVTGHLGSGFEGTVNPADAIAMGIDRVEHFIGGSVLAADRPAYESLERLELGNNATAQALLHTIRDYLDRGVYFDVTLTAYGYYGSRSLDAGVYEKWSDEMRFLTDYAREQVETRLEEREPDEQFERIYRVKQRTALAFVEARAGHLLTIGTDHPSWGEYLAGFSYHRELHALVARAGILPATVLRAATINGATALGVGDRLGSVENGKWADLVVVQGNPIQDIRATRNVEHVVKAGVVYDPTELLESVEGMMGPDEPATDSTDSTGTAGSPEGL